MISVIIPTYKEPEALDLCLTSCINGQNNENEIIVVVDGFYELNKSVLEKHSEYIKVLNLEENKGLAIATNYGVYSATNEMVLIVNDDNVFPSNWDTNINTDKSLLENNVLSINQIEPIPSIFKQFEIKDFGRDIKSFNYDAFDKYNKKISRDIVESTGSTLPFVISKTNYLKIGGWDIDYPSPTVVDWDFFYKCQLSGLGLTRTYKLHFYHFVSLGTSINPEKRRIDEVNGHEYFRFKWGGYAKMNSNNNLKSIQKN